MPIAGQSFTVSARHEGVDGSPIVGAPPLLSILNAATDEYLIENELMTESVAQPGLYTYTYTGNGTLPEAGDYIATATFGDAGQEVASVTVIDTNELIHDGLDTWVPDPVVNPPPILPPPGDADLCRVSMPIAREGANYPTLIAASCWIKILPFEASHRYYSGQGLVGVYNSTTGVIYWDAPRESTIQIEAPAYKVSLILEVPDQENYQI